MTALPTLAVEIAFNVSPTLGEGSTAGTAFVLDHATRGVLVDGASDQFDKANSAVSLGTAETGEAWVAASGTWGISSNEAYIPAGAGGTRRNAYLETGWPDGSAGIKLGTVVETGVGIVARYIDASNYLFVHANTDGFWYLYEIVAGIVGLLAIGGDGTSAGAGSVGWVHFEGTTCRLYINGVASADATCNVALVGGTKHGIHAGTTVTGAARWAWFEATDSGTSLGGSSFVDVTADLLEFKTGRGRSRDLDSFQCGQGDVLLNDPYHEYDPTNLDSSLYPGVRPRRQFAIAATVADDTFPIFTGYTDDAIVIDHGFAGMRIAVPASDAFAVIAGTDVTKTVIAESTGDRITGILAETEVNYTGVTAIAEGLTTCAAGTADANTLEYLRRVEKTEQGFLYVARDGTLTFRDRHAPVQANDAATFSDDTSGVPYEWCKPSNGVESLFNRIKAIRDGGTEQIASDADSQLDYFTRELNITGLLHATDAEVLSLAQFVLGRHAEAFATIRAVRVNLQLLTVAQQAIVLGIEVTDPVTVKRTPVDAETRIFSCLVDSISHDYDAESQHWTITFGLSPLDDRPLFILDDPVFGVLDTSILGY